MRIILQPQMSLAAPELLACKNTSTTCNFSKITSMEHRQGCVLSYPWVMWKDKILQSANSIMWETVVKHVMITCTMDQEHSPQALTKRLTVLHVPVGLNARVMIRKIDKNQLCITGLFYDDVVQFLGWVALAECFPSSSHRLWDMFVCCWIPCRWPWVKLAWSTHCAVIIWIILNIIQIHLELNLSI